VNIALEETLGWKLWVANCGQTAPDSDIVTIDSL